MNRNGPRLVVWLVVFVVALLVGGCASTDSPGSGSAGMYSGTSDPDAIENAQSLLRWLYELPERPTRRVLSGQEIGCYDGPQGYYDYAGGIARRTGKLPALIETDYFASIHENFFIDAERKTQVLRRHWEAGGLVALHANLANPWTGGPVGDLGRGSGEYSDVYTPGTAAYDVLKADFDRIADQLLELERHDVVVLFRPFHEVNGGWFWWFSPRPEEFKELWRYWHTYLREQRGVHNLLWVYSPSPLRRELFRKQGPHRYYPGAEYVDINALDLYEHDLGDRYRGNYTAMVELGKPFGFGELGGDFPPTERNRSWSLMNIADAVEEHYPQTVFWLSWSSWGTYGIMAMEQLPDLEQLFEHPLIASIEDVDFPRTTGRGRDLTDSESAAEPDSGSGKTRVGFIDCSPGYVLGFPDYFETASQTVAAECAETVEIVPVRGLYIYRIENAVDRLVLEEDCSIIFFDGHDEYQREVEQVSKKYPEVTFVCPHDSSLDPLPNVRTFGVNAEGWYYLIGIAAGTVSRSGKIGYVAHSDAQWNVEHANEFALGVAEINPHAEILFTASGGRNAQSARFLMEEGCDVLNAVADSADVVRELRAALERGDLVCAFSTSLSREVSPDVIAAGMPEDLVAVHSRILSGILEGSELPDPYWADFRSGVIRIDSEAPPFSPDVRRILQSTAGPAAGREAESVYEFIQTRHQQLAAGEFDVRPDRFDGFHSMISRRTLPE